MHKINEVARHSGFTPTTLRYYEDIGLLPAPARTEAGYRQYDDSVLERLAFIARAKQLGCSLEETAELLRAWDGGRCGPVQDQLRDLVTTKLDAARHQISELTTLIGQLQQATVDLGGHRPDGPCDDGCGCSTLAVDGAGRSASAAVSFTTRAPRGATLKVTDDVPISCTLHASAQIDRLAAWRSVLGLAIDASGTAGASQISSRDAVDGGVRLGLAPSIDLAELARLVAAEHACCQFLSFALTIDARGIGLEVRAPDGATDVIDAVFGPSTSAVTC